MMGEFGEIVLASQKVIPAVAQRTDYRFQHPEIGPALAAIVSETS
jgi:NAD dependent epimerase/dehydratase family enzyme